MTFSTFDVYKDDEEFLAFLFFFFQNVRHRIPTSVTGGSHLDTVDTFTPGLRLSLPTMIHCIEAGIEKILPLYQWNGWNGSLTLGFFDIFSEVSSLEVVSFWELQWVQTPVSCSGSDGAFMKNMRHDLDGSMRPPNPREESSGETTLTLWKVK